MWVSREMDEKKNVKICFAASSGGHYEQLMMLKPLMEKYDSFVITEKTDYSAEAKGEKTYYMKQVNRREKDFIWRMIQNAWKSIGIYRKEKPDVVICTGVLAMIPICLISKFMGKKLIYIQNLRKDREVTQEQLAIDLNISDRYMRNLEKGEKVPSVDLFVELRERFGSSLDYIVLGVSASQREQELQDQLQMLRKELKEMQRRILVMLEMLGESA